MHKGFAIIGAIMLAITSIFSLQAEVYTLDEARQLFDEGRYSEAAPTFERELKKKSNNGTLNYNYGVCLYHIGRYGDAIKYLDKAVSRKVDKAHFYLGEIYATLYRFDEAIDAYESFIDEYIAFMKTYAESDNSLALLADYVKFAAKLEEYDHKMDKLEEELTDEEDIYFLEVLNRCNVKLLESMQ